MADYTLNQKLNYITDLVNFAQELVGKSGIRSKAQAIVEAWYGKGLQDGAGNDLDPATDFVGTQFEGLSETNIHNMIGSLEALETFFGTHGENFHKVTK
jgi:hypothetical protein